MGQFQQNIKAQVRHRMDFRTKPDDINADVEDEIILMRRIAAGDRRAFLRIMDAHMTSLFRFAYSLSGNVSMAEDVSQEAYIRLWKHAGKWKPTGKVKSWLLRIAHNIYMDEMRGQKPQVQLDELVTSLPSEGLDAQSQMQKLQVADIVKTALFVLPERQRTALMLVHYTECTNIEAAQIMGVSVDALESLLARGKQQLRTLLAGMKENLL